MIRFLIKRPIAVLTIFIFGIGSGIIFFKSIPVSLLPDIEVPQIIIRADYANTPAILFEQNIIKPIREGIGNISGILNIESQSSNHTGFIKLTFNYGVKMNLAYIEVNERLDQILSVLPKEMQRPQVMRVSTSDIPVARIQIIPKDNTSYAEASSLTEKVFKNQFEQLAGISMVEINGGEETTISITPD